MIHRGLFIGLTAALVALAPFGSAWATHRSVAEQAIADAQEAHARARSVDAAAAETVANLIEEAERLMPSRQFTKAHETALQAIKQAEFAYAQATSGTAVDTGAKTAAEQAIAAAEAARQKAASVKGEWRDTAQFIKDAENLMNSGEYAQAITLAQQAQRQGELGYAQALRERGADFPSYVKRQ